MKTNKIFKWLYGLFMLMPLIAIGVTCAYVTFNKNAKDSYNSEILDNEIAIGNSGTLYEDNRYRITYNSGTPANNAKIIYSDISINWVNYGASASNDYVGFLINDVNYIYLYTDTTSAPATTLQNVWGNTLTDFIFTKANGNTNITNNTNIKVYLLTYKQNTLDNAFYYAVDQFNNSGFNKVDFVSYFDMFYNNTSIWTTFANTYFNYVLFVSLAFFVPRVLFWFINLAFVYADGFIERSQRW